MPRGRTARARPLRRRQSPPGTRGTIEEALELFQRIVETEGDPERRDLVRRIMVAIFTELGDDPLASEYRRKLAAALN